MTDITAFLRWPHGTQNERDADIIVNCPMEVWALFGDEPAPDGAIVFPTALTDTKRIWLAIRPVERTSDGQERSRLWDRTDAETKEDYPARLRPGQCTQMH